MEIIAHIKKAFSLFHRKQKIKFLILFFLLFFGAILEFLGVSLILPFVNIVMEPSSIADSPLLSACYRWSHAQNTHEFLFFLCLALIGVYIFKNVYLLAIRNLQYHFIYNNQLALSSKLMHCYMKQPYTFHLTKNSSEIIRSVTSDVNNVFELILQVMFFISDSFIILLLVGFLFVTDVTITTVVFSMMLLCSILYFVCIRRATGRFGRENQRSHSKMMQSVSQALGGIKDIKIMKREQYFVDAFYQNGKRFTSCNRKYKLLLELPRCVIETLCVCGVLGVVAVKLAHSANLQEIVPQLSVFAMAAFRLLPTVNQLNSHLTSILYLAPSVELVYKDLQENLQENNKQDTSTEPIVTNDEQIIFHKVSYSYPNSEKQILDHADLTIPFGSSVGFVGPSGSGKTTTIDLLLGILKPTTGRIQIGGKAKTKGSPLGYIPQNIYLADDSIRNNIAFGIPEQEIVDANIWQALEHAQLKDFVEGLPDGLDTQIGEQGVCLSGGQRQRIGIARALYHDPSILVLDEATSALDNDTEAAIIESIEHLHGKKTLIMIAHRLSTIRNCDKVFRVEHGRILPAKIGSCS